MSYLKNFVNAVSERPYVVIDTETTGLRGVPVSIAIVDSDGKELLYSLVKPNTMFWIEDAAQAVHGITEAMVATAPTWDELQPRIEAICKGKTIIAYNAQFDRSVMERAVAFSTGEKMYFENIDSHWVCAMLPFAEMRGEWNSYHQNFKWAKLTEAAAWLGVAPEQAHNSLGDAITTARVVKAMIAQHAGQIIEAIDAGDDDGYTEFDLDEYGNPLLQEDSPDLPVYPFSLVHDDDDDNEADSNEPVDIEVYKELEADFDALVAFVEAIGLDALYAMGHFHDHREKYTLADIEGFKVALQASKAVQS